MYEVKTITSDEKILDINNHFKVIAGPGAGKTYWLVNHIKNVIQNTTNLSQTSKIACITYTTVGAEEIKQRLGILQDKVEVCTIHNFLYRNVVKPYVYLVKDGDGSAQVNVEVLDGHYENVATGGKIYRWQERAGNSRYIKDKTKIKNCLEQLDWKLLNGELILRPRKEYSKKIGKYSIRDSELVLYKNLFWEEGVIHHEDVLYFSYRLLRNYPIILTHMSAKYPFVFVDEFQDTNPVQTEIIKWIGNTQSVIGVIGDPAQSIYGFQGASREDFLGFSLENQKSYVIENNRRSGSKIVKLLNSMRKEDHVTQKAVREESSFDVFYIQNTGKSHETTESFLKLREQLGLSGDYCILTRQNNDVRLLRGSNEVVDVWTKFYEANSADREQFVKHILTAYKLAKENRQEVAIREALQALRTSREGILKEPFQSGQYISPIIKRGLAVDLIELLVGTMDTEIEKSLKHFYESLSSFFQKYSYKLTKITSGKIKEFSVTTALSALVNGLILPEEKITEIRTIHKSKGMEFESVLVYLTDISDVERIIKPNIDEDEETRILYVAFSRARDLLCVACPQLESKLKKSLQSINLIEYTTNETPVGVV